MASPAPFLPPRIHLHALRTHCSPRTPPRNHAYRRRVYSSSPSPPPLTTRADALRTIMRQVPHPVVILTTTTTLDSHERTDWRGITLSSFNTLSLDPALVSFNIRLPSSASAAIHANGFGRFAIHLLSSTPQSAALASAFAQLGAAPTEKADPWPERTTAAKFGVPLLLKRDGVIARLVCESEAYMKVADHEIWVGRVLEEPWGLRVYPRREARKDREGGGWALMYADRRFRDVGEEVKEEARAEVTSPVIPGGLLRPGESTGPQA